MQAVLCGMPEPQVFDCIEQAAIATGYKDKPKMTVKIYRNRIITAVFDDLTKTVLTQAECELMDGCCPTVTRIFLHQTPTPPQSYEH